MITKENLVVNGLWIGEELSAMELLTLHSFTKNGHQFHLWAYDSLKQPLPKGVLVKDANEIIPEEEVFSYRHENQFGHGKGSVAGFSDVFRYKLLFDNGGWWVDMDVTCLSPFNSKAPYYFREHHELPVVGNIIKCPKHSSLMHFCYVEAKRVINQDNKDWHLPLQILNNGIESLDLRQYIVLGDSPPDKWDVVSKWVLSSAVLSEEFLYIHWLNEVWRSHKIDKESPVKGSLYQNLLEQYGIPYELSTRKFSWLKSLRVKLYQVHHQVNSILK